MTGQSSRRDFLGMSALGLAAAIAPKGAVRQAAALAGPGNKTPNIGGEISIWVTSGKERFAAAPRALWGPARETPGADQIQLDPSKKFQEILGFGGAFTDAACYMLNQLAPPVREQLFHEMFHPSEMGLSVCRICVGSSDYAVKLYSFDDGEADPDLARFSIEHDREYILPAAPGATGES
jgi:glucosylceramidase